MASKDFLKSRPVVRRATKTHYQIRQLRAHESSGYGAYLVWPDGRLTADTRPLATTYDLEQAVELARRER